MDWNKVINICLRLLPYVRHASTWRGPATSRFFRQSIESMFVRCLGLRGRKRILLRFRCRCDSHAHRCNTAFFWWLTADVGKNASYATRFLICPSDSGVGKWKFHLHDCSFFSSMFHSRLQGVPISTGCPQGGVRNIPC